ncbi:unnamed protein product [Nezara viridula]|uniref:Odorant receptor n=1 Tax=Nezara viridula TaxID=85310 RepID=A0A9P0EEM9_NEZVI|nr:unnamed protein product [Nezara viridula]
MNQGKTLLLVEMDIWRRADRISRIERAQAQLTWPTMGESLTLKLQRFIDYLNNGFDESINDYMDSTYLWLTTISAVFPTLNRDRPFLSISKLFLLIFNCSMIMTIWYLIFTGAVKFSNSNFILLMNQFHFMALVQMSLEVVRHSWMNRPEEGALHKLMVDNFFDYEEELSGTWTSLREVMKRQKRRCIQSVCLIGVAVTTTVILIPTLNSLSTVGYSNKTLHDVYMDLPIPAPDILTENKSLSHFLLYLFEILGASCVGMVLSTKCMMCIESNLYIQMHLKLLVFQYENIETRALTLYRQIYGTHPNLTGIRLYSDLKFSYCIDECLKKNIQHHQVIIKAVRKLNTVYGCYVFSFYLTSTAAIAMSILSTSSVEEFPGTAFGAIIICIIEIFFVALYSHFGQSLTNLGEDLREEIYNIKWYYLNKKTKNTIKIIQIVAAKQLSFSFHNILLINYDSFSKVLNSAYSYYNLVNANDSPEVGESLSKMNFFTSDDDLENDELIDKTYNRLTTISAIYPVIDKDRPRLCLMNLALFLFHSLILTVMTSSLVQGSVELFYINFVPFVNEVHIAFLGLLSIAILWHSWLKRPNVARLHRIIARDFFDYKEDLEDKMKTLRDEMMKERKRHILYIILIGFAASVVVILIPAVNQFGTFQYNSTIHRVNFDLPVPLPYPFLGTKPLELLPGYIVCVVTASSIALMNCTKSFMAINCNLHIQMQLKLLLFQIENIESRAGKLYMKLYGIQPKLNNGLKLYETRFMKCYSICLRRNIQHHQIIIR